MGSRRASGPRKRRFSFRHISESTYHILEWDSVWLIGRAYGISAFVVNKHQTTLVTKKPADIDRFDRIGDVWQGSYGPTQLNIAPDIQQMFNQMMHHHEMVIARMITE